LGFSPFHRLHASQVPNYSSIGRAHSTQQCAAVRTRMHVLTLGFSAAVAA